MTKVKDETFYRCLGGGIEFLRKERRSSKNVNLWKKLILILQLEIF